MKIGVAQTRPIIGDIQRNLDNHKKLIDLAIFHGADLIIFPELSLTGYEPKLARQLATTPDDSRFDDFQQISNSQQITIGVGVPTKNNTGIRISLVLFQPHQARQTYSKTYLHPDEAEFFVSGQSSPGLIVNQTPIALAICYEISVPAHMEQALKQGPEIYVASVAKFVNGIDQATKRLAEIARTHSIPVLMSNCVGPADGSECAGKTSIWNSKGILVGRLNETDEGIIIFNPDTQELIEKTV